MDRRQRKNLLRQDKLCIILLVIIGVMTVIPFMYFGKVLAISDWSFHANRIEQIYRNLKAGHLFTFIATSTFDRSGVASFLFYPTLFMYPWALLRLLFNPVISFYIWYSVITIMALLLSYYSMVKFSGDRKVSFAFSIIYVFNNYRLYLGHAVFGEFVAVTFIPIAFLGLYYTFFTEKAEQGSKWLLLPISMSLVTYTHIVSIVILVEIFIGILSTASLCGLYKQIFSRWLILVKSIFIWLCLSLPVIYLFATKYIGKGVSAASFGIQMPMVIHLTSLVKNSIRGIEFFEVPFLPYGIGLILIFTAFIGWYYVRNSRKEMFIYGWGIFLLLISTNVFPWAAIKDTPFGVVQITVRYLSYACFFLSIIAAKLVVSVINRIVSKWQISIVVLAILGVLYYGFSQSYYLIKIKDTPVAMLSKKKQLFPLPTSILDKANYSDQFNYNILYGETDYFPNGSLKHSKSILNQTSYFNNAKVKIKSKAEANKFLIKYEANTPGVLNLPIVVYEGTYVTVNGKNAHLIKNSRETVCVYISKKGINNIEVGYNPGSLFYISIIFSFISWIMVALYTKREGRLQVFENY